MMRNFRNQKLNFFENEDSLSEKKLIAFLYLLMRDAAPTGEIVRIVRELKNLDDGDHIFTSPELEAYAKRLAGELLP